LRPDGSDSFEAVIEGAPVDALRIGREAGRDLARRLPANVLTRTG